MAFNSWKFVLSFRIVYTAYLLLRRNYHRRHPLFLVVAYRFCASSGWRFAGRAATTAAGRLSRPAPR